MGDFADDRRDREDRQQERMALAAAGISPMTPELRAELEAFARKRAERARSAQPDQALREHVMRGQRPDAGSSARDPQAVQVRIVGAPKSYGYLWRGAEPLDIGDWVTLPGNEVSPEGCKGEVTGFGRGGYSGPLKEVTGRLEKQDRWEAEMSAVRDKATARRLFAAAKRAGLDPQALLRLERIGREALKLPSNDVNVSNALDGNGGAR